MQVATVGLDLAKYVFQAHGITDDCEVAFNRALRRSQVLAFFESLEPCMVGIEACGTSHHCANEISKLGHDVKLIPPTHVKPYVKRSKSEAVDAAAICEAVTRKNFRTDAGASLRFVQLPATTNINVKQAELPSHKDARCPAA